MVYRTHPLEAKDPRITRALVMVHGQNRNADDYFRTAVAAAFLAGALEDTLVIAPRFSSSDGNCRDKLEPNEVNWPCSGNSWRAGGPAVSDSRLTSYDLMDEVLRKLARKAVFPNLKAAVVAGHSAGGQFAARYAMANLVHEELGMRVTYLVSNPSSYAYLDALRPVEEGIYRPYADRANCTGYDRWPFGLEGRSGYAARLPVEQLRKQLAGRPVTYLLGELDTVPLAGFDSSCPAMAQGPSRLARGQAFHKYVNGKHGARHELILAPMCGHNARCVFTADPALKVLFPEP
jgi:pimeloyl-ACP methyl ester carboxylesterase